jgi:hypothetical protein
MNKVTVTENANLWRESRILSYIYFLHVINVRQIVAPSAHFSSIKFD